MHTDLERKNTGHHPIRLPRWLQRCCLALLLVLPAGCGTSYLLLDPATVPDQSFASTPEQVQPLVFETPEAAIIHYFEGVAQGDVDKILQACAVDEMSEHFAFDLYTERLASFVPPLAPAPTDYPLYVEINKSQRTADILNRVKIFAFSLLSDEEVNDGRTILIEPDGHVERIGKFRQAVDPARLAQIEVKRIELPDETLMKTDSYGKNAARIAAVYGADESTERIALFTFEGYDYLLGFTLLRYGESWKISDQVSPLANTNYLGAPEQMTD